MKKQIIMVAVALTFMVGTASAQSDVKKTVTKAAVKTAVKAEEKKVTDAVKSEENQVKKDLTIKAADKAIEAEAKKAEAEQKLNKGASDLKNKVEKKISK